MKKSITIVFLLVSVLAFSQKVKMKKDKVIIDDVEVYNFEEEGRMTTFSTLSNEEFASVVTTSYQERNQGYNPRYSSSPQYLNHTVYTVKFLSSGKEVTTDIGIKKIAAALYKSEMIDANGKIDEEKLNIFINKYNNENLKLKIN